MKKLISTLIAAALAITLTVGCGSKGGSAASSDQAGDQLARIRQKGEVTIATEGTWSPWTFHNEKDELVGFDVEVAEAVAEKLGVKAKFIEGEWDGLLAGIEAGRYDIMANGVEITAERNEKFDFSEPYGYIRTAIIVRGSDDSIKSFEDLKGKTTANTLASTYATLAEDYGATAMGVDDLNQTIELLLAGRVDATLNAEVTFYDYMKAHPEADLKIAALTDEASEVAVPMTKGEDSASLKAAIDAAIEELRKDGKLSEISVKYFGSDISGKN